MKMKILFVVSMIAMISLTACATAHKISQERIGMTKQEVIELMGQPVSTSAQGDVEYFNYSLSETGDDAFMGWTKPYYVRIINGKVESYGRTGDFNSTKTPTVRIETDEKIKQDVNVKDSGDLYTELKKLKELKDSGIITEEEFEARKKKILEKY